MRAVETPESQMEGQIFSVTLVKLEATYLGTGRTLMCDLKRHKNVLDFSKCALLLEITM
jgi:hypothetical protein